MTQHNLSNTQWLNGKKNPGEGNHSEGVIKHRER